MRKAVPIYETLPGWKGEIGAVRDHAALPREARDYLARLAELLGRPVTIASVGPDRDQTMFMPSGGPRPCPRAPSTTPAST